MRLENGSMQFFEESIDPGYYGHVVLLAPIEMLKVEEDIPMEKILEVRREAKRKVFVRNAVRALENRGSWNMIYENIKRGAGWRFR